MVPIYGNDFAFVYNDKWAYWGEKMWPFLRKALKEEAPDAFTWLDLCCGAGSLLKFVCEEGFSAVGVDSSEHQLNYARQNAPEAKLCKGDIRKLSLPQTFDVITCMFDSLNYLTLKQDLAKVFYRVQSHLNQDGLFAFDMNTFHGLQEHWCTVTATHDENSTIIVETSFNKKRALGRCLITGFLKDGDLYRKFQEEHIERGYKVREIEDLLRKAGFVFKSFDGVTLKAPGKRSGKLLYLCHKKTWKIPGRGMRAMPYST
jgi:SAM-dependent methyltransferase